MWNCDDGGDSYHQKKQTRTLIEIGMLSLKKQLCKRGKWKKSNVSNKVSGRCITSPTSVPGKPKWQDHPSGKYGCYQSSQYGGQTSHLSSAFLGLPSIGSEGRREEIHGILTYRTMDCGMMSFLDRNLNAAKIWQFLPSIMSGKDKKNITRYHPNI